MIGKIVKGTSFSGCVNYVLKEDKSRLLKAVGVYGSPEEIAEQFELQTLLNDKVKNTVGHISLSFSVEDGDRIRDDDGLMLKIAHDYMKLMGIENTQFIIARHTDRDHPHCHIVYNRVDNDGRTISDKNDRYRNEKVCKMLTARYRLHFAEGKEHVNFMRLRHHDRVKYFIYHALKREVPNARSWSELRLALRRYGIDTQWKLSRTTGKMQGVKFTCNQQTFSGSKIDRQFSFLNIDQELRYNALSATMNQRHVQVETICEEPRHEYQQENHAGISLGLFTPSPTDYDTEEAIQANRLKKKKKKKLEQQRQNEASFKKSVDTFRKNTAKKAAQKISSRLGISTEQADEVEAILSDEINTNSPDMGIKSIIDSQKKKLLISQTYRDKDLADIIYNMLVFNNVPPEDIIYTNCDDEVSRIPEGDVRKKWDIRLFARFLC